MGLSSVQAPTVAVLKDAQSFAALKTEWEELYRNSPLATPFQSWSWLYSWWESYGKDFELRLITVRDEGLLVGIIPLMLQRRWSLERLLFIGTGLTDFLDMLARGGWESKVSEAGIKTLERMNHRQVLDLWDVRPTAAIWSIFHGWRGYKTQFQLYGCPVIEVVPWDKLLMSVNRKLRSNARRTMRKAKEDGVSRKLVSLEDTEQAARRFVTLHREWWRGRNIGSEHLTHRFETHIVSATRRMTACGIGGLSEFWRGGEVIAAHLLLFGQDFVAEYLFGATQEARQRYQLYSLFTEDAVNVAVSRNISYYSMLRGEESYKLQWEPSVIPNYRLCLGRNPITWSLYLGYQFLRFKAVQYVGREDAPQWIKETMGALSTIKRRGR